MPPKKKKVKKVKKPAPPKFVFADGLEPKQKMKQMRDLYRNNCTELQIDPLKVLMDQFRDIINKNDEEPAVIEQLTINEEISPQQLQAIVSVFLNYQYLKKFCLWKSNISDEGCAILSHYLIRNNYIEELDLMQNNIGSRGCSALAGVLYNQNTSLKTLILDHNQIGDEGAILLVNGLRTNPSLKTLSLQFCGIGITGGVVIGRDLLGEDSLCHLETLLLQGNPTSSPTFEAIGLSLKTNTNLKEINLKDTAIDANLEAASIFAEGAANCPTLTTINLHYNLLNKEAGIAFIDMVKTNRSIISLSVPHHVGTEVLTELIAAIEDNLKLLKPVKKKKKKKTK
eukprot:TRINITY_DN2933_c4_g2_i1.p1 TRINITY_DN2933_c4_g2~~TRINITY_DN2933_c4_g2_i1.p1  ORF type:complete len:352 (+),score=113.28 TRINITY_DN2933_c4_g2_i1:35-1057(+)